MATIAEQQQARAVQQMRFRKLWLPALFLTPAAFFLLAFMAIPMARAIMLSFQRWNGIAAPEYIGLTNYTNLLQDPTFWQSFGNTILYTVAMIAIQTTFPLVIASMLNSGIRASSIFRFIYFLPVIISLTITGLLWGMIFEPNFGILNEILRSVGLKELTQLWLADKALVMPSIIMMSSWQALGFYMMIFFAAMQAIPEELYEAAAIDGAGIWHRFRHVTIPMLRSTLIVVIVLNTINGIKVFDQVWVLTAGGPNHASETLGTYLYRTAFGAMGSSNPQLGYATAIAMVILMLSLLFSIIQIRVGQIHELEL